MSDKYVGFENFTWVMDVGKSELTTQPGEMRQCEDGHINQGGEVEQRKSFVKDGVPFPASTYGLQDTDEGLVTFSALPLSVPIQARMRLNNVAYITPLIVQAAYNAGDYITISNESG